MDTFFQIGQNRTTRNAKNLKSFHLYRCWARRDEIQDGVQVRGRETHHIVCSRPDHQGDYRDDDDDDYDYDRHAFSGSLNIF